MLNKQHFKKKLDNVKRVFLLGKGRLEPGQIEAPEFRLYEPVHIDHERDPYQ